jgi:hypothetical protein
MALVFADLVQETTSTTGTGTLTLSGAVSGFQSFAAIGNTNTTYYRIKSGLDSEVGIGTYTLSGTTLSRDTVLYSSAGGTTKITVATGATVSCVYPAEKAVVLDANNNTVTVGAIIGGSTSITSSATITPTSVGQYNVTALSVTTTIAVPSFTGLNGQKLIITIKDNGTSQLINWTTTTGGYRKIGTILPLSTLPNKTLYIGCIYNLADNFWDVVTVTQEL